MLILSRKVGERIMVGDDICVVVTSIRGHAVRLGVEAPAQVTVDREELRHARRESRQQDLAGAVGT